MKKMKEIKVLEHVPHADLVELHKGNDSGHYTYVESHTPRVGDGFQMDLVIISKDGQFYKFAAMIYLDDEVTFTVPYQVFPAETVRTVTTYSHYVGTEGEEQWPSFD